MPLSLSSTINDVRLAVSAARARGLSIGLVPTMGALHEGHASLIRAARKDCGFVVVSIFVNPTQFGPNEDFTRYPRTFEQDQHICFTEGVDLIFVPDVDTMYPPGSQVVVEVRKLQDVLCGASRPGHFRGVATIVLKLLNIVQPDRAYFGQKDAQQTRIIQQMVRDLDVPVEIRVCPIVRETDGLALSSRNRYLTAQERANAVALHRALQQARAIVEQGERSPLVVQDAMHSVLNATSGAVTDYAEVLNAETLQPMTRVGGRVLLAVAVRFGATRLIDNEIIIVS